MPFVEVLAVSSGAPPPAIRRSERNAPGEIHTASLSMCCASSAAENGSCERLVNTVRESQAGRVLTDREASKSRLAPELTSRHWYTSTARTAHDEIGLQCDAARPVARLARDPLEQQLRSERSKRLGRLIHDCQER